MEAASFPTCHLLMLLSLLNTSLDCEMMTQILIGRASVHKRMLIHFQIPKSLCTRSSCLSCLKVAISLGVANPLEEPLAISYQGFAISVTSTCLDGHVKVWNSQPHISRIPPCSVLLPAAVVITGGSYATVMEILEVANVHALSPRERYNIHSTYVIPEVDKMWSIHNEAVMSTVSEKFVVVSGDARCDSPGHNATSGTYSLLDADSHLIVAQEIVSVTEVRNSYWLEPEGLTGTPGRLADYDVTVLHLATDRHLLSIL